jgi:hypothetical protein
VGSDAENAQRARALFELFEDFSPLTEEEYQQFSRDYTSRGKLTCSYAMLAMLC